MSTSPSCLLRCISLDFLELPVASSCHEFLHVHIDLLNAWLMWLVPTFKRLLHATFAGSFWMGLHERWALLSSLAQPAYPHQQG